MTHELLKRSDALGAINTLIESLEEGLMTDAGLTNQERDAMRHQIVALHIAKAEISALSHEGETKVRSDASPLTVDSLAQKIRSVDGENSLGAGPLAEALMPFIMSTLSTPKVEAHPDDQAVDRFAEAMKVKLANKRAEGRGGWDDPEQCSGAFLSQLLVEHVDKGDPLDVGNLAMMLHQRGERIAPAPTITDEAVERIEEYYSRQIEWSRETFGPALRTGGVIDHIRKELKEIEADPHDLSEWVDVIILAMDGFWRHGGTATDLMPRLLAKQRKNMARTWPDWRTMSEDRAIEHDRSGEADDEAVERAADEIVDIAIIDFNGSITNRHDVARAALLAAFPSRGEGR